MIEHITSVVIAPEGEPIFSERAYKVEIEDDAAGQFIKVSCELGNGGGTISFDCDDWPALRRVINRMVVQANLYNSKEA